jgi:phage terminase Nu1 subunit (DNA packaging protein)
LAKTLNRTELAAALGVSLPTIDRWRKDGMPVVTSGSKGVEWAFDLAAVVAWRVKVQVDAAGGATDDIKEIEKRTARAKMEQAELALAEAKSLVAPIAEFERAQAALMAAIRQNVLNVPQRAVLQLLGETDESTFKQKLRAELVTALEQAAAAELTPPDDEDDEDESS